MAIVSCSEFVSVLSFYDTIPPSSNWLCELLDLYFVFSFLFLYLVFWLCVLGKNVRFKLSTDSLCIIFGHIMINFGGK